MAHAVGERVFSFKRRVRSSLGSGVPPLQVFLAEDDVALRSTIALLLEKDGHDVIQARDGVDLMVDLASRAGAPEDVLVVTDVRMPMVGGLAVLRSLCRQRRCPRFILMTGFATPDVRHEAKALGALALFDKPFDLDDLRRLVSDVAANRRAHVRPPPGGAYAH